MAYRYEPVVYALHVPLRLGHKVPVSAREGAAERVTGLVVQYLGCPVLPDRGVTEFSWDQDLVVLLLGDDLRAPPELLELLVNPLVGHVAHRLR